MYTEINVLKESARAIKRVYWMSRKVKKQQKYKTRSRRVRCSVCNGSKLMSIVSVGRFGKEKVNVPCTVCGGSGRILFVEKIMVEESGDENGLELSGSGDGWRDHSQWKSVHYFRDGNAVCNLVKSKKVKLQSKSVDSPKKPMCAICSRRLARANGKSN